MKTTSGIPATNATSQADDDIFTLSKGQLLAMVFGKTSSPYYTMALAVARGALHYKEQPLGKSVIHTCVFGKSSEQAARAIAMLRYVENWSTTQLFVGGRPYIGSMYQLIDTLNCYQMACQCNDASAHCLKIVSNPFERENLTRIEIPLFDTGSTPKPVRIAVPCSKIADQLRLVKEHPSTWSDQFQALSIKATVDWCPKLDMSKFRQFD